MKCGKNHNLKRFVMFLGLITLPLTLLSSCGSGGTTSSTSSAFYCSVTGVSVVSGTNELALTITASGGTANYTATSITASGTTGVVLSGGGTFASAITPTVQFSSLTNATLLTASGTVTVQDSSSPVVSTSCSFSATTTSLTSTIGCTATPSISSPSLGQSDVFTFAATGSGTAPYTFSSFVPGTGGSVTSGIVSTGTTTATATASYATAGTQTASVTVSDSAGHTGSCTAPVYVQTTASGSSTCTLNHYVNNNQVILSATSSTGEPLSLTVVSPGVSGVVSAIGNPSTLTYYSTGQKTVSAYAVSTSTGTACNGGTLLYDSFYVTYGGTTGSTLACTANINNSQASYRGTQVVGYPSITSPGYGGAYIYDISFPTASGMTGYYNSGRSQAYLTFPNPGSWLVTFIITDSGGQFATCSTTQIVN